MIVLEFITQVFEKSLLYSQEIFDEGTRKGNGIPRVPKELNTDFPEKNPGSKIMH